MKNTYRFFVPPEAFAGEVVRVNDAELAHQLGRVLRLGPGDQVVFLDGRGEAAEVALTTIERTYVAGRVERRLSPGGELPLKIVLYLALLRPERFEWALQKAVELGVEQVVPVRFARSLPGERADEKKLARWRRIVREAAEQSCRGRLPALESAARFDEACARAAEAGPAVILWEGQAPSLRERLQRLRSTGQTRSLGLFSGPEGGITADELTFAHERGIMPVSLGPRVLRAETAPLTALASIAYEFESP